MAVVGETTVSSKSLVIYYTYSYTVLEQDILLTGDGYGE